MQQFYGNNVLLVKVSKQIYLLWLLIRRIRTSAQVINDCSESDFTLNRSPGLFRSRVKKDNHSAPNKLNFRKYINITLRDFSVGNIVVYSYLGSDTTSFKGKFFPLFNTAFT